MEEIVKHINDTNASYRTLGAGDAKNTDLFLDNEHYELFRESGEKISVRFNKKNLAQAILFISSILPRKFDQSAIHKTIQFSNEFVFNQLAILDALFVEDGVKVDTIIQEWNARKNIPKKNGEIDKRFYFNGLLKDVTFTDHNGKLQQDKFTIRNYLAGGYSELHIKKAQDGVFDVLVENVTTPYNDGKENEYEDLGKIIETENLSIQQIFYGAPGTGKSYTINRDTAGEDVIRTTFHPDTDYSTFVGAYKPTTKEVKMRDMAGHVIIEDGKPVTEERIVYEFVQQAFLQAYVAAWKKYAEADGGESRKQFLVIEEINRGNCAQIFGDLFQLLDRNAQGFSDYPITADADMKRQLKKALDKLKIADADAINALYKGRDVCSEVLSGDILLLPNNLYIWATMNTSDQSLFPIDSAFKRRWDWTYRPISDAREGWKIKTDGNFYDWWTFLEKINEKVGSLTNSEDKKLGYFFCKADSEGIIHADTFVGKVIFYLWNDVFKDYEFGDTIFDDGKGGKLTFDKFYKDDVAGETKVVEGNIALFLKNLGIEPVGDENEEYAGQQDPNADVQEDKTKSWSATEMKRYQFWTAFLKYANERNSEFAKYFGSRKTPSHDKWYNFPMGHSDCNLVIEQTRSRNELEIKVYFNETTDSYYKLLSYKEEIEQEMGVTYNWMELQGQKASKITEVKSNVNLDDESVWESAFKFFIDRLLRMRTTFLKYLNK